MRSLTESLRPSCRLLLFSFRLAAENRPPWVRGEKPSRQVRAESFPLDLELWLRVWAASFLLDSRSDLPLRVWTAASFRGLVALPPPAPLRRRPSAEKSSGLAERCPCRETVSPASQFAD